MLRKISPLFGMLVLSATMASAAPTPKDHQVANGVSKAVNRYAYFTIFDDVNARVKDGVVTLTGKVTDPIKAKEIAKRVAKVDGVVQVRNGLKALPVSRFDDQLRARIARSIYRDGLFQGAAFRANPPVHIVVEHGRVTLTGVVDSEVERMTARSLAAQFGALSVTNNLKTVAEVRNAVETS